MQIETGMYVRTKKYGIAKIIGGVHSRFNIDIFKKDGMTLRTQCEKDILKASYNIIDLIEVGDYVNGHRVYRMHRHATNGYLILELELGYDDGFGGEYDDSILEEEIKSIVTHEQFDNIKYEVK